MEKCIDSDYSRIKHDSSKSPQTWISAPGNVSLGMQFSNKRGRSNRISKSGKKIALGKEAGNQMKEEEEEEKVLNGNYKSRSVRQSVQNNTNTKITIRKVPDRLGKSEKGSEREYLDKLGTECLSNKEEAVRLSKSIESDLETKNIFENFFDDCLDSTSLEKDASSQETFNLEDEEDEFVKDANLKYTDSSNKLENEKTPVKKNESQFPKTPIKIKDHNNYHSNHKKTRHVCSYCQKIFKSNGKLNSHVYSHTGERPFDCHNCGKAFSSKFKLVRHLLIHSEVRKFVCQICDRTFLRNDHLKNHYKVHDPQKKMYKCPKQNCNKEYSSLMSHKKHMAHHNVEDGDLKCLICNIKYETKEEILFHLKSHSGSRLFKTQNDKKFKCDFCERLFLTRKDVTRHLVVHTGERDFLCQFCPQRFGRKDHLVRHIKKGHVNVPVKNRMSKKEPKEKDPEPKKEAQKTEKPLLKQVNTQTEEAENKTHIVITVHGQLGPGKSSSGEKRKSQQVEKTGKEVPSINSKNSATQILLQNVPNILIIPNNSIILVKNESVFKKSEETKTESGEKSSDRSESQNVFENDDDFNLNFNYDSNIFQSPQFSNDFSDFQTDLVTFNPQFDETGNLQFETENLSDDKKGEINNNGNANGNGAEKNDDDSGSNNSESRDRNGNSAESENLLSEASRQIKLLESGMTSLDKKKSCQVEKDFFEENAENLILNDSILSDFKEVEAGDGILQSNGENSILNSLFAQSNDSAGNELLSSLLASPNPVLSPLPGFSQIFQNANANCN